MSQTLCRVHDCGQPTQGFMCKACLSELERALAETQSLRHEVSVLATGQAKVYRSSGAGETEIAQQRHDAAQAELWEAERAAREAPIAPAYRDRADRTALPSTRTMVNLAARDMLAAVDTMLVGWARVLHEHAGVEWQLDTTEQVIVWLTRYAEAFRWHEAAAEAHHDITDAHRRMQRAVDRGPSRVYAGPCDTEQPDGATCRRPLYAITPPRFDNDLDRGLWWADHPIVCDGYRPLFDRSGDWRPDDTGCGTEHGRDDRRGWMIAEIEDRLLPLSLLMDCLPELLRDELRAVPPSSVMRAWVSQGRMQARTVIEGVEFFRGGDMITLLIAYRPHKYAPRAKRGRMAS